MVSPLACQVGSCLVWPCCFPRLVLFGLVPSPLGPVVFLVGPAPFYRRMVWLLPLVSSNVIVTCLVPSPRCGVRPVVVLVGPACVGQCVLQRYVWYGCCRLLAVMSSLRARYHTKLLFSPCKRCACPCSDAVHSPSSPPSGLRGFVPVVRDAGSRGGSGPGGTGAGGREGGGGIPWGGGGGWEPGTREHIYIYIYIFVQYVISYPNLLYHIMFCYFLIRYIILYYMIFYSVLYIALYYVVLYHVHIYIYIYTHIYIYICVYV